MGVLYVHVRIRQGAELHRCRMGTGSHAAGNGECKVNTEHLARTIRSLRELEEKEPNTVIQDACSFLDIFLEKLVTKEIVFEKLPYGTLRMNLYVPPEEMNDIGLHYAAAKITASFEYEIQKLLERYDDLRGFERVTWSDMIPILKDDFRCDPSQPFDFWGYAFYKKKNAYWREDNPS